MIKKQVIAAAALVSVVSLALTACSSGDSSSDATSAAGGTINAELWYAPTNFNPATASGSADVSVARLGFDTLLREGEDGIIGGLATDWEATSDTEYTFTIRDDATCSDGTVITPSVVAASLEYFTTSEDSAAQASKATVFGSGTPTFTADDDANTVVIGLSEPYSEVISGLTTEPTGIICPAGLDDLDGLAAGTVGGAWSGPYTLEDFSAGVSATYTLREDYDAWPAWTSVTGNPASTINISVSSDSNTSANLLSSGGIDITRFYDSNADRFVDDDAYSYVTMPSSAYTLIFNQNEGTGSVFLDRLDLRTAVSQAIDKEGFNAAGLDGLGTELTTVTASTVACTIDGSDLLPAYDVEAATTVLSGETIRLLAMTNWDSAIDFIAESLRAAGATVELSVLDPADWQAEMRTEPEKWDLALNATNTANPLSQAISTYVGPSSSDGGRNISGADNAEGYDYLQAALASTDTDEQCANFEDAQTTILTDMDMTPLITDTHFIIARDGFASSVFSGYWDMSAMRITG
ncbi:peptide/nickel transport system substrate-binding protein [Microbacterium endophyticum]|uniref:Peptide/nickel transport system substrate-binding protein n=1 Tax=Microbacterium endophyticum TaxID=1526412 RepID=A0A7W4YN61_9MICO|nr:ABC transporter substrate-binding protein [Microbacterium endophyticum]MBB2975371.1 peptide/nickel transport system substrate-binding protein [Microbacterium endophyticum]NIK35610.1 peptide/nickel transport system substrate-binding protein [Microbacterium endophyticum]